ncbi:MAG: MBL fold metallo-hydrolase, partial [Lentisphaeria bacterium]|nr:MBL fold metallo-hydrolase [Lentisphaeria bacterium]
MERRDFLKRCGLIAAMFGLGDKAVAQEAKTEAMQPVDTKRPPKDGEVKITFIGTSHGRVTTTRAHSCSLLQTGGKTYVIDAGEGAVANIMKSGTHISDINAIFITHPHLDHYGGL